MNFDEYKKEMKSTCWNEPNTAEGSAFEREQPSQCPKCGFQVFDPFVGKRVLHDIRRCQGLAHSKKL